MTVLLSEEAICQRLASRLYRHARNASRIRLLATAVMVEPDLLPNSSIALERLCEECPDVSTLV
jgi:hypothetical protein